MASVVKMIAPVRGVSFYYNVSAKVGPYGSRGCVNNPTDVELVNLLLSIAYPPDNWPAKMKKGTVTRGAVLDAVSCFLIYVAQDSADDAGNFSKNERPDGTISVGSASGGSGQGTAYSILWLNGAAKQKNASAWQRLYEQPGISPTLRAQITHSYT